MRKMPTKFENDQGRFMLFFINVTNRFAIRLTRICISMTF